MADEPDLRAALLAAARSMSDRGLNVGTSGNASVRCTGGMLITPTGLRIEDCDAHDMVFVDARGKVRGDRAPSSEWPMHLDVYADRPEAAAVLHAHSPFATALACRRLEIPAFHYMIARFGGSTVRCAGYATFGTQALSDAVRMAMQGRSACLLANHGMLVFGHSARHALDMAVEFETLCEQYWRVLQLGEPVLLSEAEMSEVIAHFAGYGQPQTNTPQAGS